jgi:DMSO reductase family type II enzyme heme b subunit
MQAHYVSGAGAELLDPDGKACKLSSAESVKLEGTPLDMQPTAAIKASWANQKIGVVEAVQIATLHDGGQMAFRLEWRDPIENREITDTTTFPDCCGILLPTVPYAPMAVMGAVGMAVNAWYWRADENGRGRHVLAEGLGTSRTIDHELVRGSGVYKDGRWQVVITRAMKVKSAEKPVQLEPVPTARRK